MENHFFILVGAAPSNNLSNNPGGQLTMSVGICESILSLGYRTEVIDTLQASFPLPSFGARLKRGLFRIYQLMRLLNRGGAKGVIILSANGPSFYERILMAGLCRFYHVKSVFFMLAGPFVGEMERSWIARSLAKKLLNLPDFIGIQGDSWRQFYRKLGVKEDRLVTIRNWLSSGFMPAENPIACNPHDVICFCFVGWLIAEKGVRELFEAIKSLVSKYTFDFVFVGGGTLHAELDEKIKQSNLSARVKVTGWVDSRGVYNYLKNSHVFILPSKAEGFPLALLEAMSLGLPAICTNVGAVADSLISDRNGYLLKSGSPEFIAEAMQRYLINPDLVLRHSIEALSIVEQEHGRVENCRRLLDLFVS